MNTSNYILRPRLAVIAFTTLAQTFSQTISLETAPPVVVKTMPTAGAIDVDPNLTELRVVYSKPMQDGSWSWSTWGEENFPETTGQIHYESDQRTCVLPVKLQPGKFYATWLNSEKFRNFKDQDGQPAVPYLLTFTTETEVAVASRRIPSVADLPGELTFHGRYRHRSRGRDIDTPSELWVKESSDGSLSARAQLPFSDSAELALGNDKNALTGYRIARDPSGNQPGYSIDLKLTDGMARLTRRGIRDDVTDKTLTVPKGAWFDPNTRPDPYCAANILLRAFDLQPGETKEFHMYDWDNSGEALADYTIQVSHAGKERVEVPAGAFEANHLVVKQLTSADTWFKKRAGHITDFWVLDNHVIVRVLRHREPYEMKLLDYTVPEQLDAYAATSTMEVRSWVENFFANNYRDITSRDTLEWGSVGLAPEGNLSIRYQYRAKIWDKETVTNNQVFTFDPAGRFISAEDAPDAEGDRAVRRFVRVVLDGDRMTFEGEDVSWENLENLLNSVPDRAHTVLEWAVPSTQITIQQQANWTGRFAKLAQQHGFEYSSYVGVHPFRSKGGMPPIVRPTSGSAVSESDTHLSLNGDHKAVVAWTDRQFLQDLR